MQFSTATHTHTNAQRNETDQTQPNRMYAACVSAVYGLKILCSAETRQDTLYKAYNNSILFVFRCTLHAYISRMSIKKMNFIKNLATTIDEIYTCL